MYGVCNGVKGVGNMPILRAYHMEEPVSIQEASELLHVKIYTLENNAKFKQDLEFIKIVYYFQMW